MERMMKQIRIERGMTQAEVAQRCGITSGAYNMIENGKRFPSYPVLCKLEDLFHRSHRHLLAQMTENSQSR